ncbi:saccharopine dehydrogenase family protein [Streptomyces sp. NPDC005808]|uniref:saccharopine dehydrogenase family protein n=1 Tax=Streptomyces sp. NPDC005808 TaxID=3364734 RepID=UPI0036C55C6B
MPDRASAVSPGSAGLVGASGTVHWVGTGLSVGPTGLGLLCDRAGALRLWGRTRARAEGLLARLHLTGRAEPRGLDNDDLAAELRPGDIVVSMLPATEHPVLLRTAIEHRAHFASTSYVSEGVLAQVDAAEESGTVVLTEAGLDPGIDHLMAHRLVDAARKAVGDQAETVDFTSYCGGLPAVVNDFRYRFSWAPYGVLTALGSPARYVEEGAAHTCAHPWEATRTIRVHGEDFEAYPNRNSVPFIGQYGFPEGWNLNTFVRGTLRNVGWRQAWEPVFATLRTGDPARIRTLADELAARYPATAADRDRVVLTVALRLRSRAGAGWRGEYRLNLVGSEDESAMALCVSLPLAFGVTRIIEDALPPGLHCAAEGVEADCWLAFLRGHGIQTTFEENHLLS